MDSTLTGIYTALVTPFDKGGAIVEAHLPPLLAFQRRAGVDGFVVGGTNGEGVSMSVVERKRVLELVLAQAEGLSVIAGTGASSVSDAIELTRHASDVGCDAVLVLPPFFFRGATTAGLAAYYRAVAAASTVPMILYSIPQFSGIPIAARLTETLADEPLVMGVKESSGLLPSSLEVLQSPRGMRLYVGSDDMAATLLLAGAAGVISGTANAFPELLVAVRDAIRRGSGVWEAQARLTRAIRTLIRYPVVANMKAVLAARGFPALSVRPPLVDLSPDECATMLGELEPLGVLRPV